MESESKSESGGSNKTVDVEEEVSQSRLSTNRPPNTPSREIQWAYDDHSLIQDILERVENIQRVVEGIRNMNSTLISEHRSLKSEVENVLCERLRDLNFLVTGLSTSQLGFVTMIECLQIHIHTLVADSKSRSKKLDALVADSELQSQRLDSLIDAFESQSKKIDTILAELKKG